MNGASARSMVLKPGPDDEAKPAHRCALDHRVYEKDLRRSGGRALLSFSSRPQKPVGWLPFLTS